jgi:seryl-tRNA(Sec) selenium transferase
MGVTAKSSANYTDADITIITDEYTLEPTRETVNALAARLNKTERSVIAKLSALGVYQKAERVTKRGEPVVMKAELVSQGNSFNFNTTCKRGYFCTNTFNTTNC